jgi:hypothetical protein
MDDLEDIKPSEYLKFRRCVGWFTKCLENDYVVLTLTSRVMD